MRPCRGLDCATVTEPEIDWSQPSARSERVKNLLAPVVSKAKIAVVVNSFGRSGSTVLYESVIASAARGTSAGERIIRGAAWRLDRTALARGRVYKTHDYPQAAMASARVLYVFGDPIDAARSLIGMVERMGQRWMVEHCTHLRVPPVEPAALLERDALSVAEHLTAWSQPRGGRTALIRYEAMWDHRSEISDFLGFEVTLAPRVERQAQRSAIGDDDRLAAAYAAANSLVTGLPDFSVR